MIEADRFRQLLEQRLHQLEQELAAGADAAKPVELDPSRVGRLSRMDAIAGQAMSAETQQRRKIAIARAKSALLRIDDGSFGDCAECGEPIGAPRLEHDPSTPLCIDCVRER